jgi:hypothetical protein
MKEKDKQIGWPNIGTGSRPFPQAKPTKAQRDEEEFMQIHGGPGSRFIYLIVEAFSIASRKTGQWVTCLIPRKNRTSAEKRAASAGSCADDATQQLFVPTCPQASLLQPNRRLVIWTRYTAVNAGVFGCLTGAARDRHWSLPNTSGA